MTNKILWLTGQPGAGKTVIGKKVIETLEQFHLPTFHIDGDDLRKVIDNKDYSEQGRINNIRTAQIIAKFAHSKGFNVIVSLVSPYKWLRDMFKDEMGDDIVEYYVHTSEKRERDHYHVENYEPPTENFIDIDTTIDNPTDSLQKVLHEAKLNV